MSNSPADTESGAVAAGSSVALVTDPVPTPPDDLAAPLPVDAVLPALRDALAEHGTAVLEAPPGAGKTTRVPLDLLAHGTFAGRLVLLEPRRLAARGAAQRLAAQLGEEVGGRVGLVTRDERRVSVATRIEVVTDGVLLRRLQRDPSLPGVGLLVFDEFHERRLESDLGLAFALETRSALRGDLQVLVTSATLDGAAVASLLGDAPVVRAEGRAYPVTVRHLPQAPADLLDAAVDAIAEALAPDDGDVLVFLPGVRELTTVARRLPDAPGGVPAEVRLLHGGLPPRDQDLVLGPATPGRRRVVLATDVAETSLTVPGVVAVVDAGRSRQPRFDAATGMTGLVTVPASRGSAEQRAGRAGRLAPGRAIRLWTAAAHASRDHLPTPAIHTDDLTGAALEVAVWGAEVDDLALLDPPDPGAWRRARQVLHQLGAIDAEGRPTSHGRALAALPLHPRLAHLVVVGADRGLGGLAADLAAVLADRDPLRGTHPHVDLATRVAVLRGARPPAGVEVRRAALDRARKEARRIRRLARIGGDAEGTLDAVGGLVALAYPDRVAAARPGRRGAFLLANGRGATVPEADPLAGEPFLAVAAVDRGAGGGRGPSEARIHLAAAVEREELLGSLADQLEDRAEVAWRDGDVIAERRRHLGALALVTGGWDDAPVAARTAALLDGLRREGLALLGWSRDDHELQARMLLLHRELGPPWPDVGDEALLADAEARIGPFLGHARRRGDLARVDVRSVLLALAPPTAARDLDTLAPTSLRVPSGRHARLRYGEAGGRPVLAVKLQELFGATRTPSVVEGRVPVVIHLLSPAGRPVQVTDDLPSFWANGYAQVRAELRGRYRKHPWPEDPTTAAPTARTTRRR
ncbi:ATP-dependent helicase HrpB [Nitriliruptor alkaliphilus]|uniref:ATP-dependent helicase HrpB n=1 Tax=Nitriliruptor alkaliphilus TaxID=427918 RepID=UPI000A5E4E15|nr:ATP-dependent helicase HrpB [Nitriliruptor alkaliphilus]